VANVAQAAAQTILAPVIGADTVSGHRIAHAGHRELRRDDRSRCAGAARLLIRIRNFTTCYP